MVSYKALNTTRKSTVSNSCDTIGNIYASERSAIVKSLLFNRYDTIWNIYNSERCAITVFASLLLSIIYILNGRKVIAWIL